MKNRQQGAVLAVSLILVVVASMLGVAGMGSSQLGERVAGNQRQVSEAFMAAETGISRIAGWLDANAQSSNLWASIDLDYIQGIANNTINRTVRTTNTSTAVQWNIQGFTKLESDPTMLPNYEAETGRNREDAAWFTISGEVVEPGTERIIGMLYERETLPKGLGALSIIGGIGTFSAGNSNTFEVIGELISGNEYGAAIATSAMGDIPQYTIEEGQCVANPYDSTAESNIEKITNEIQIVDRESNYVGGIREVEFPTPFDDPEELLKYIEAIEAAYDALDESSEMKGTAPNDMCVKQGNACTATGQKITVWRGTPELDTLELQGNQVGSGVLIVRGNLNFYGTVQFDGLVIVTGNAFSISGGGNNGISGALIVANPIRIDNPDGEDCYQFGEAFFDLTVDVDGGGNATLEHNQENLVAASTKLATLLGADYQGEQWNADQGWTEGNPRKLGLWTACTGESCTP